MPVYMRGGRMVYRPRSGIVHKHSALPTWVQSMSAGNVKELLNTKLTDVAYSSHGGTVVGSAADIVTEWGTFAHDSTTSKLYAFGGGHVNYNGNESYVFDARQDSPTWAVFSSPTATLPATNTNDAYGDGKPAASHQFNLNHVDPIRGRMYLLGIGSRFDNGSNGASVFGLDLSNQTWTQYTSIPGASANTQGAAAAWDSNRQKFWIKQFNTNQIRRYDPATDTYESFGDGELQVQYASLAYDPVRDCLLSCGGFNALGTQDGGATQITVWDCSTASGGSITSTASINATGLPAEAVWGLQYYPPSGDFVAYRYGNTCYRIAPTGSITGANWTATAVTMNGDTAPNSTNMRGGIFGKWRYDTYLGVFLWCGGASGSPNNTVTNMFAYKPDF